jgi:hypothetical protein
MKGLKEAHLAEGSATPVTTLVLYAHFSLLANPVKWVEHSSDEDVLEVVSKVAATP